MVFALAWQRWAVGKCWPIAAPRVVQSCLPEFQADNRAASVTAVPAPQRLKRRAEFLLAASKGRKAAVHGLVLQALARESGAPARVGFTVTRKVGNAVIRNRTRRRLKEAARLFLRDHPVCGVDLVLIGRDTTRGRDFGDLIDDFRRALAKVGVI